MNENKNDQQETGSWKLMSSQIKDIMLMLDKHKGRFLLSALLLVVAILFRSFEPKILQMAVDYVLILPGEGSKLSVADDFFTQIFVYILPALNKENTGLLLLSLALMYVGISLLRGGSLFGADALKANVSTKFAKDLRDRIFRHIQQLPLSYFSTTTRGELIQRSTGDIDTVYGFINGQLISLVRILAIFGFAFMMMALANWEYALICIAVGPLVSISSYIFFKKERIIWKEHEEEADRLNEMVQENLNGIRLVGAYANEEYEIERFKVQNEKKRDIGVRHNMLHTLFWSLSDMLVFIQLAISMLVGGYFAVNGKITLGELLSFYTYIGMVMWPMRSLGRILSEMGMAAVAMQRLKEVLEANPEKLEGNQVHKILGEIAFENVSFRYKKDDEYALQNVSFHIHPGEKVAIIGPTGSGKSTLLKILLRLHEPEEGKIFLDKTPLTSYSRKSLRQRIGIALQKPFLFSTSIRNNIAYANAEVESEQVDHAASVAQISEIQDIFPEGMNTIVGEKGVTLSGGQKQRVALARTLLDDPEILILDDITSALDTHTEQALFTALDKSLEQKTTLIISHRITSIQRADRILVMENGRIVQEGTAKELEKQDGYYKLIHEIQSDVEDEIQTVKV